MKKKRIAILILILLVLGFVALMFGAYGILGIIILVAAIVLAWLVDWCLEQVID